MKIRIIPLLAFWFCLVPPSLVQSQRVPSAASTPPGRQAAILSIPGEGECGSAPGPDAVYQDVSYYADAPVCGEPTVSVQTLTNPFSQACLVFVYFSVDDDIIIDGEAYQSPGTDFTFHDTANDPCPDANGAHSDQYCRMMDVGEQITLGVRNNFRGQIYLYAQVYFDPVVEVQTASIRNGQFVIIVDSSETGTLDLILKRQGSDDQVVLKTFENQSPGMVTVNLDDIMNVDGNSPLDGQDGIVFDRAAARWRSGDVDVTSADRDLDVPVEVLSQRTISNYFSPTWGGFWGGQTLQKGVYPAGQFPDGLYNVDRQTEFLNALDYGNEGLAMDGNIVIRTRLRHAVRGFPLVTSIDRVNNIPNDSDSVFGDHGYICFPDVNQRNTAPQSTVAFLRDTSVAVRPNADRLSYRTADQVYVPGFAVRTVDDRGGLHGNTYQIDVWIGQGDQALRDQALDFGIRFRTCLKILNQ